MKTNTTPAVRKQTVWIQIISLVSVLLATLMENQWFMGTFSETGGYVIMAYNALAIILSFINPIGHKKNLEILEEPDENQADDSYSINNLKP